MAEELELMAEQQPSDFGGYDKLVTLTPREHIRQRPGMYIGKLGDGSQSDDGVYVLIKEVIDNSIDEFNTGFAKPMINIDVEQGTWTRHSARSSQGCFQQDEHRCKVRHAEL